MGAYGEGREGEKLRLGEAGREGDWSPVVGVVEEGGHLGG